MTNLFYEHINQKSQNELTIIFLHEGLGCTKMYRDFPEQVCRKVNLSGFIYDRYGYGESAGDLSNRTVNYLEAAADNLKIILDQHVKGKVILYGHSDGGSIALIYAAKYPEKIVGIITEAAHVFVEDITLIGIKKAVMAFNDGKLNGLKKYHNSKYQQVFWAWANTWLNPEFKNWNIEIFLPKIQAPQLIIQGIYDQYATLNQVKSIERLTFGKTKVFIPECNHSPFKEIPSIILKEVINFTQDCHKHA